MMKLNNLELYCGIKSSSYNEKICPECKKKYKYYVGTVAYLYNKLQFCSYNCRSKYKAQIKEEQIQNIELKKEQQKRNIEKQKQREKEKYKIYKQERELYKSIKDINEYDLSDNEKTLFYALKYLKTQKQIAEEMNISVPEVRAMKIRLIEKLKEQNNEHK